MPAFVDANEHALRPIVEWNSVWSVLARSSCSYYTMSALMYMKLNNAAESKHCMMMSHCNHFLPCSLSLLFPFLSQAFGRSVEKYPWTLPYCCLMPYSCTVAVCIWASIIQSHVTIASYLSLTLLKLCNIRTEAIVISVCKKNHGGLRRLDISIHTMYACML